MCARYASQDKITCRLPNEGSREACRSFRICFMEFSFIQPVFCLNMYTFLGKLVWISSCSRCGNMCLLKISTCGSRGCTAGSSQTITTCVKLPRSCCLDMFCTGLRPLPRNRAASTTTLPAPAAWNNLMPVSSMLTFSGVAPLGTRAFKKLHH